jgi:hypothetical protein
MVTEATLGTGAEMADIESIFEAEAGNDPVVEQQGQQNVGAATQNDQEVITVDENGNVVETVTVEVDADGNEVVIDDVADANQNQPAELVIPDDHKVKLTIDGKDVEYTFADLKAKAQLAEGAHKRFDEAAAIRKEYTEKAAGLQTREQQLGQVLQYYINQTQEFMQQEPNWADLIQNDPQKYLTERHNWEVRQAKLNEARQVQANLQRHQAEQAAASAHQRVEEAKRALLTAIPEWADPKKAAEGARAIDAYLHEQGIAPEMRAAIDSAQVLLVARKAMLYDQAVAAAKARKAAGGQQVRGQAQPVQTQRQVRQVRVERPGAATAAQTAASRQNLSRANAAKAFNANPSVDTLATFFE